MKKLPINNKTYLHLETHFEQYLRVCGYNKLTVYGLCSHIREFLHWLEQQNKQLGDWTPADFYAFWDYLLLRKNRRYNGALSNASLNHFIQALHLLQRWLNETAQLHFFVKLPHQKTDTSDMEVFTREDIDRLYAACSGDAKSLRCRAILALCYGCGLRRGEAIALNLNDICWDRKLLQVRSSKSGKSRIVPLASGVDADLRLYVHSARPLFLSNKQQPALLLNNNGKRVSKDCIYRYFKELLQAAGLPQCGLHRLRHSIATHLADSGMNSEQIARFLGHSSLNNTQIYIHLKNKTL